MLENGMIVDGKYKILNKIGRGGMSTVYLAMNERANRQWAIKEIQKKGNRYYRTMREELLAETDILKRLDHPNLPKIGIQRYISDRDGLHRRKTAQPDIAGARGTISGSGSCMGKTTL